MTGKTDELVVLQKDRNEEELNSIFYFTPLPPPTPTPLNKMLFSKLCV